MKNNTSLYLIDGNAYIHRAYHAISPLANSRGLPTHAIYGFLNILRRVIKEKSPDYLAVAFDTRGPTFRHQIYKNYKANRPAMPEDLSCQIPYIKKIVQGYNIPILEQEGMEADDLLASVTSHFSSRGEPIVIVSGDKDLLQLINETTIVWDPMKDLVFDNDKVREQYQVEPEQILDLFSLMGDSSDNIPGVPGVGQKTAIKLIQQFSSMELLYENIEEMKKSKLKEKLLDYRDQAFLSRDLIRLKTDAPIPEDKEDYRCRPYNQEALAVIYRELEFDSYFKETDVTSSIAADNFFLITSVEELTEVIRRLEKAEILAVDTETNSLDFLNADMVGLSLALPREETASGSQEAWYIPLGHRTKERILKPGQLTLEQTVEALKPVLTNPEIIKLGHNIKFDYKILHQHNLKLQGPLFDTMIASYLLEPSRRSHKLDDLASAHLNLNLTSFQEVTKGDKSGDAFIFTDLQEACAYACEDVAATLALWHYFEPKLKEAALDDLFVNLETPLIPILAKMEETGIKVDPAILTELSKEFDIEIKKLEEKIYLLAGEEFNINSPKQLGHILFDRLQLPYGRKTKTGYSTDIKVLEKLASYHELPKEILTYRTLSKLKSTYVDKLYPLINPRTGRIHCSFNQTVTATGRLSSSNPNLQNLPVHGEQGQKIREAFVAEKGYIFLAADYSQIDLRVLAHYCRDETLLEAFRQGRDIHSQTAAEIFRVNPALITPSMRRVAKSINFGIVYGMRAYGLSEQLGLSRKEADTFITRYFNVYPGIKKFMQEITEKARDQGYVTTLLKRRRVLPDINSSDRNRREFAERTALNTPIQGSAADIIKLAALAADQALRDKGLAARMLLQIHDELIFEVPEEELGDTEKLIKNKMESVIELGVPLQINLSSAYNLASLK
ncbi:MAG: DNA polymerase I [Desulfurivibrionaceae bacterium]